MNISKYTNKVKIPALPMIRPLPINPTPKQCREYADLAEDYANHPSVKEYYKAVKQFDVEEKRLHALFKNDALRQVGLYGHPKADMCYEMAEKIGMIGMEEKEMYPYGIIYLWLKNLKNLLYDTGKSSVKCDVIVTSTLTEKERSKGRTEGYHDMSPEDQWAEDKRLGILDWDGD